MPKTLKKNQLPMGEYIIGKDIPPGKFDFDLVYGNGTLELKVADESRPMLPFIFLGRNYDYESDRVIALDCREGDSVIITGNIIVEISRAQDVIIDL